MTFTTTQKIEDISNWFRTICEVTTGNVTDEFQGVLALDYQTRVSEVLATLEDLEIQSVAVCGPPGSCTGAEGVVVFSEGKQVFGIVSIVDVLAFSLKHQDYLTHQLFEVIGSTQESKTLWCEDSNKPLYFSMEQFISGVHHSLVKEPSDNTNAPLKYLAQIDIVRYLTHHQDAFPALGALLMQPVEVVMSCFLLSVSLSTPLTEAIELLTEHSALPVVNTVGVVVSNLSASDFKGKSTTALRARPGSTVLDLLVHQAIDEMNLHQPHTVTRSTTLLDAARYMLEHHIHRVWVVPAEEVESAEGAETLTSGVVNKTPLLEGMGVLTLTDILRAIYISESN